MLEVTLNTQYTPGTNLKGDVTGANWMYLLHGLNPQRVLIAGVPRAAALRAVARIASRLVIATTSKKQLDEARGLVNAVGLSETAILASRVDILSGLNEAEPFDLLFLADKAATRQIDRDAALRDALRNRLKPGATVYFESRSKRPGLEAAFGPAVPLWLTPLAGEMHTAVPAADTEMTREMLARNLDSRFVSVETIRAALRRGNNPSGPANAAAGANASASRPAALTKKNRSPLKQALHAVTDLARFGGHGFVALCNGAERALQRSSLARRGFGRFGNLAGSTAGDLLNGPPRYLRECAANSNIDISDCRWCFAAGGEYSSRKMLFLLFDRQVAAGKRPTPRYLVKMTRDPQFNARLERECSALRFLEAAGLGNGGLLPRAIFAGTAGQLAIVGESFIDGVPLDAKSEFTTECPVARSAVEWLTRLGETTADESAAAPEKIAEGLRFLLDRFAEIYAIDSEERGFMESQLDQLANSPAPVPLVFQHGDPGRWNVFATRDNRAIFLDWESAEPDGLPLWDLFYFLRSFSVGVGSRGANRDVNEAFHRQVLCDTPVSRFFIDAVANYARRVGLPAQAIEPLFYTCWMHRALKEATRLPAASVRSARYFQLLRLCIQQRESSNLKTLFSKSDVTRVFPTASAAQS